MRTVIAKNFAVDAYKGKFVKTCTSTPRGEVYGIDYRPSDGGILIPVVSFKDKAMRDYKFSLLHDFIHKGTEKEFYLYEY